MPVSQSMQRKGIVVIVQVNDRRGKDKPHLRATQEQHDEEERIRAGKAKGVPRDPINIPILLTFPGGEKREGAIDLHVPAKSNMDTWSDMDTFNCLGIAFSQTMQRVYFERMQAQAYATQIMAKLQEVHAAYQELLHKSARKLRLSMRMALWRNWTSQSGTLNWASWRKRTRLGYLTVFARLWRFSSARRL